MPKFQIKKINYVGQNFQAFTQILIHGQKFRSNQLNQRQRLAGVLEKSSSEEF